jgi:hypothetical protein
MKKQLFSLGLAVAVFASIVLGAETTKKSTTADASMVGEQIKWQVIGGGGTAASSVGYKLNGTVGQTATTLVTSVGYRTQQGYWNGAMCCFKEGDFNHNGTVNVVDVTSTVSFLFQGGPAAPCKEEADVTDNGGVNVVDLTTLVAFLFSGGSVGVCP